MIISTNPPYFAPYPGFFYKAHLSDYFVILDLNLKIIVYILDYLKVETQIDPRLFDLAQ